MVQSSNKKILLAKLELYGLYSEIHQNGETLSMSDASIYRNINDDPDIKKVVRLQSVTDILNGLE